MFLNDYQVLFTYPRSENPALCTVCLHNNPDGDRMRSPDIWDGYNVYDLYVAIRVIIISKQTCFTSVLCTLLNIISACAH